MTVTPPGFEAPLELLELGDGDRVGVGAGAGAEAALGDMDCPALGTLGAGAEGLTERGAGDDWNPPLLVRTLGPGVGVGVGVVLGLTEVLGAWVGRGLKLLVPGELNMGAGVLLTVCLGLL